MGERDKEGRSECQNATALEAGAELNALDLGRMWARRMMWAAQRRLAKYFGKTVMKKSAGSMREDKSVSSGQGLNDASGQRFRIGELVEVLTFEEIRRTLDEYGKCDGLEFMEGMKNYCGLRLPLKRKVARIYDERSRRMLKMKKGRYILDDAICDGQGMYDREGCDRCCFYFWSDRWLRKASSDK